MILMKCNFSGCRVDTFVAGEWDGGLWKHEDTSAWSALKPNCCPGCGEESVEVTT